MALSRTEKISHYGVVLIAITAVVVSVWQGRISQRQLELIQEHNRLTVKPHLDLTKYIDSTEGLLEVRIANEGFGPAVVREFTLQHGDSTFASWNEVLDAAGESRSIRYLYNYEEGRVVAAGFEGTLVRLETANTTKGVTVRMVYESIYQERDSVVMVF